MSFTLLGLEALLYIGQMLIGYLYGARWTPSNVFDAGDRPAFLGAIVVSSKLLISFTFLQVLFSFSELFYAVDILFRFLVLDEVQFRVANDGARNRTTWHAQKYNVTAQTDQKKGTEAGEPKLTKIRLFEQDMFSTSESSC